MKKTYILLTIAAILLVILGAEVTVAYLVSSSNKVENTFTVGSVGITLTETTGTQYKLIPGATVAKDPTVTVIGGSESCWLFVQVEKIGDFDGFCSFEMDDGWAALAGHSGIYYRQVERSDQDTAFPVLKNNRILIHDSLTEELLNALAEYPTLKLTAYAAQSEGLETAHDAWHILNP